MHPCFRSESWNFRWSKFDRFICSIFIVRELHVYNNKCLTIFIPPGNCGFLRDVSLIFIDTAEPADPLKREDNWKRRLKTKAPFELIIKKVPCRFISNILSILFTQG